MKKKPQPLLWDLVDYAGDAIRFGGILLDIAMAIPLVLYFHFHMQRRK